MSRSDWKSLTSSSKESTPWWIILTVLAAILLSAAVGTSGCAAAKLPPLKTYEQAKKEVVAKGPLVTEPIEKREGYPEGTSTVVKKNDPAPYAGIVIDADKARYYVAVKAERDRRRKELEAARQSLEIQKIINKSSLDHIEAKVKANDTWWERNKGLTGLAFGVVIGIGLVVGVLYAVTKGEGATQSNTNTHVFRW